NDWEWGTTVSPYPTAHSGTKMWGTKLISNYSSGPLLSSLETPEMQVVSNNASLTFWHTYDFESSYDGGNVKMSKNGGAYNLITPQNGYPGVISTNYDNPLGGQNAYVSSSNWVNAFFDLSNLLSAGDIVKFKFDFGVDNSIQYKGWYVDDISFTGVGIALPVELISFNANTISNGVIEVTWTTATEENNLGFDLERSFDGTNFNKIAFIPGNGTTTELKKYLFTDNVDLNGKVYYRLRQIDYSGLFSYSSIVVLNNNLSYNFGLEQNYPNPFNPTTNISFSLKEAGMVTLSVYNILGEKVADLLNENLSLGKYSITFDANKYGLNSGVYFIKLQVEDKFNAIKKMNLVK
ncbi:MAG TPA: immune inhibitor A, partial [Melioribacteraceae bacterium]|nr:immune inhibitor A [Melioribacteraceae bacterium]